MDKMEHLLESYGFKRYSMARDYNPDRQEDILQSINIDQMRKIFTHQEWSPEIKKQVLEEELMDQICGLEFQLRIVDIDQLTKVVGLDPEYLRFPKELLKKMKFQYNRDNGMLKPYMGIPHLRKVQQTDPEGYEQWIHKHDVQFKMEKVFKPTVALENAEQRILEHARKFVSEVSEKTALRLQQEMAVAFVEEVQELTINMTQLLNMPNKLENVI